MTVAQGALAWKCLFPRRSCLVRSPGALAHGAGLPLACVDGEGGAWEWMTNDLGTQVWIVKEG